MNVPCETAVAARNGHAISATLRISVLRGEIDAAVRRERAVDSSQASSSGAVNDSGARILNLQGEVNKATKMVQSVSFEVNNPRSSGETSCMKSSDTVIKAV